jgi:GxxExxY protein
LKRLNIIRFQTFVTESSETGILHLFHYLKNETMEQYASVSRNPINGDELNALTDRILDCCFAVHRHMGPGLSESIYEECLRKEFDKRGLKYDCQQRIPIFYCGELLEKEMVLDLIVEDEVILELKAVSEILPVHESQLMTYLRLTKKRVGYLLNFNAQYMKHGIKRMRIG